MARTSSSRRKASSSQERPDGELRQSQMITTYGPGAMVDLVADAILIPGLEYWKYAESAGYELQEQRLADSLRHRGWALSSMVPFRKAPVPKSDEATRNCGIEAIEFPNWFLCPEKGCGSLIHRKQTAYTKGRRRHRCSVSGSDAALVPVRFVTACPKGHLDDFPWEWFVHAGRDGGRCEAPDLRLFDEGSGDLSDVRVRCETCGEQRRLSEARHERSLPGCRAQRPWLSVIEGDRHVRDEDCSEAQRLLVRTASNGYFSQVESALTIPPQSQLSDGLADYFSNNYEKIYAEIESLDTLRSLRKVLPLMRSADSVRSLSDEELWRALEAYRSESKASLADEPLRVSEYRRIVAADDEVGDPRYASDAAERDLEFIAHKPSARYASWPRGIQDLVLVKRLREIRVLTGFTRLSAPAPNIYGEFELETNVATLSVASDWLPACELRGEGFFFELDLSRLRAWEQKSAVRAYEAELKQGFLANFPATEDKKSPEFPGIRFYLLHSLSHMLMNQVALDCGYAASAIRERIYCSPPGVEPAHDMAGILLSTGSSGSEGTLGGLVEQGRRLREHLARAFEQGRLCSHDPVCARHSPTGSERGRALLGAACHGCMFVAECSCERANHYLDRALVVPTVVRSDVAYFCPDDFATPGDRGQRGSSSRIAPPGAASSDPAVRETAAAPSVPANYGAALDFDDFDEPWHPLLRALLDRSDIKIEPGGEVSQNGRVLGDYALCVHQNGRCLFVVDARERGASKSISALAKAGRSAAFFDPAHVELEDILSELAEA